MIHNQEKLIQLLAVLFPKAKIYLFGSRARGTHRVESDVDLAIDNGERIRSLDLAQAKNIIEALNIPQKVDLVDFQSLPENMKTGVLQEGILWKS